MQRITHRHCPFTLIELLAVIAILIIVAGIVIGGAGAAQRKAAEAKARSEISKFEIAVQKYKSDHGYLPQDSVLNSNNEVTKDFLESFESPNGNPYLNLEVWRFIYDDDEDAYKWMDPLSSPYRYKQPGDKNPESYDVWSAGSDVADDTADDIGNFSAD